MRTETDWPNEERQEVSRLPVPVVACAACAKGNDSVKPLSPPQCSSSRTTQVCEGSWVSIRYALWNIINALKTQHSQDLSDMIDTYNVVPTFQGRRLVVVSE